jgi:hypothetical protein
VSDLKSGWLALDDTEGLPKDLSTDGIKQDVAELGINGKIFTEVFQNLPNITEEKNESR